MKNSTVFKEIRNLAAPVFIWGMGELGQLTKDKLCENNILVEGFVVDDEFLDQYDPKTDDLPLISKTALEHRYNNYILMKAILSVMTQDDLHIKEKFRGCIAVYSLSELHGSFVGVEKMTHEYYIERKKDFKMLSQALEDDYSKKSLDAFLYAKLEEDSTYLYPYVVTPQYFFKQDMWEIRDEEVLVDGGAFTGDSIQDFLRLTNFKYKKIYALEPDMNNAKKLSDFIMSSGLKEIHLISQGLYSQNGFLCFDSRGDMLSKISPEGMDTIQVTTIDNLLEGNDCPISIIKMDIEGSEMEALYGAKQTIQRYHPMMYISAYHKKDDLLNIYQYLKNLYPEYRFFFRVHKPLAIDAVLYAIPPERIIG